MSDRPVTLLFATSGHSGVDRIIANLLPEFARVPRKFHLLGIRNHGPVMPESLPPNIRPMRLGVGTKKLVMPPLVLYLRRYRPEFLLTANHQMNRAALLARRLSGVDTRITIRMGMSIAAVGAEMTARKREALHASMRRWYPLADSVVAPSRGVADDLRELAGVAEDRLYVIRNPLLNERFYQQSAERVDHPWYGDSDIPVVLAAGSLEPRKDFATLLRAFALLRQQRPARLIILGEGKERPRLAELAKELGIAADVSMPGFDSNPYRHMARADVFVLSSRREGASAVIIEAMACGTPVVSTDCPSGPSEALANGELGPLVPVGDHVAMAAAIDRTLLEPPDPEMLRAAVQEHRCNVAAERYLQAMGLGSQHGSQSGPMGA